MVVVEGSCVIRMLVAYLGEEPFRQGMVKYLQKYKYNNAFTEDLWAVLGEHTSTLPRVNCLCWITVG